MKKRVFMLTLILSVLSGCVIATNKNKSEIEKKIRIGYNSYPSSKAGAYLTKIILEENGYLTELKKLPSGKILDELADNKIDVTLSCWLPDLNYGEVKEKGDNIVDIGVNYKNSHIGLYVPKYTLITSAKELNLSRKNFSQKIYVPKESPYLSQLVKKWSSNKDLKYDIISISEKEIERKLKDAKKNNEWVLIAAWSPYYLIDKYSLRTLEDTDNLDTYKQEIHTVTNAGLKDEQVIAILKSIYLEESEMNELLTLIKENEERYYKDIIASWINNNRTLRERFNTSSN